MSDVEELFEDFADLDEREACELLDELGREIPEIPQAVYDSDNLVPGCQSRVWLVNTLSDSNPPKVGILADSDAFVVKGLIYVVLKMYADMTPQQVLDVDYVDAFDRLGLGRLILPQRKNGLYSMVRKIRNFASAALGEQAPAPAAGAADLPPVTSKPVPVTRPLDNIVQEFPALAQPLPSGQRPIFLDSGASAQKPRCVIEKEREVEENYYANAFRGKYYFGQRIDDEIESTRAQVAGLLGARSPSEIVFTAGTTMALNMVAHGWARKHVQAGEEIVITEMEHHANFVPWQMAAQAVGASLRILPITAEGRLEESALDLISERTALVACCSMSNVLGTVNPIDKIVARAREAGAVVVLDAAQSLPHAPIDVQALDVDFVSFSGHKIYGPSGVGVLYGKHDRLLEMDPLLYGGHMIERVGRETSTWAAPPSRFEAGTLPIVQIIAMGTAIEFLQSIGYEAIAAHEHTLLQLAHERLGDIDGLRIHGPAPEHKGAIVSFDIAGVACEDLAFRLDARGIFTRHGHHCAMVLHERLGVTATTRASFGVYNTARDVEAFASAIGDAVAELAEKA